MIRVVIDTGVVLSAAFKDRKPKEIILTIAGNEDFEWIASPEIIKEYAGVLAREKFGLPPSVLQKKLPSLDASKSYEVFPSEKSP